MKHVCMCNSYTIGTSVYISDKVCASAHGITNMFYFSKQTHPIAKFLTFMPFCYIANQIKLAVIVRLNFAIKITVIVGFNITRSTKVGYLVPLLTK